MSHAGICTVSARQDEEERCAVKCAGVCIFCYRTAAISAPFTPLSTFRFQLLPAVAFLAIDVDITFHYVTSQFSALVGSALPDSALLGVPWRYLQALAFLGDIDARKSRRSQISALLAGIARRSRSVGSHHMQPSMATSRRRWRSHGVDDSTPSH